MCKAIVIVNDTGSAKRLLGNHLRAAGIEVHDGDWIQYCKLHQAVPSYPGRSRGSTRGRHW